MSVKGGNFFTTAFGLTPYARGEGQPIAVDVIQHPESYILKANIPGVKKEEVSVSADGDVLIIAVNHVSAPLPAGSIYIKQERVKEFIQRAVRLPPSASIPDLVATYAEGVLTITIPRKELSKTFEVV